MSIAEPKKILLLHVYCCFFFLCTVGAAFADLSIDGSWHVLDTKYVTVHYHSIKDLKEFNNNIDFPFSSMGLKWLFKKKRANDIENEIRQKVDAVYEKTQEILDMRKSMKKVEIFVSHDKQELDALYQKIYKTPCHFRAWYNYESNAVYVNANDVHEGILAHELAHSIIDNYLLIRPPEATTEILARYVDAHLFD
jgi:hypothetical protein